MVGKQVRQLPLLSTGVSALVDPPSRDTTAHHQGTNLAALISERLDGHSDELVPFGSSNHRSPEAI
jgi:hypothetical protein